jgi:hypothetical protein
MALVHGTGPLAGTGTAGCAADGRGVSSGRIRSVVAEGAAADGVAALVGGGVVLRAAGLVAPPTAPAGAVPSGSASRGDGGGACQARASGVPSAAGCGSGDAVGPLDVGTAPLLVAGGVGVGLLAGAGLIAHPVAVGPVLGDGAAEAGVRLAVGTGVATGAPDVAITRPTSATAEAIAVPRRRQYTAGGSGPTGSHMSLTVSE